MPDNVNRNIKDDPNFLDDDHYEKRRAKNVGYADYTDYLNDLVKKRGFKNVREYNAYLLKQRGFDKPSEQKKYLAKMLGFKSPAQYDTYLQKIRAQRPRNKEFARWLKSALYIINRNHCWLAEKLNVRSEATLDYCHGYNIPKKDRLEKIYKLLTQYGFKGPPLPSTIEELREVQKNLTDRRNKYLDEH